MGFEGMGGCGLGSQGRPGPRSSAPHTAAASGGSTSALHTTTGRWRPVEIIVGVGVMLEMKTLNP